MAIKTTLEQIEEVQAAISRLMIAKETALKTGDKSASEDLSALEAREEKLLARYRRENGGGLTINNGIPRRD